MHLAGDPEINPGHEPMLIDPRSDIEIGIIDPRSGTFRAQPIFGTGPVANVVRVTAHRTALRGNAATLSLPIVFGRRGADLKAVCIAMVTGGPRDFAFVATEQMRVDDAASITGSIACSRDIQLAGRAHIDGDARPGVNASVLCSEDADVSGWRGPLDRDRVYAGAVAPGSNDNIRIPGSASDGSLAVHAGELYLPAGKYVLALSIAPVATLRIDRGTAIYLSGDADLAGSIRSSGSAGDVYLGTVGKSCTIRLGGACSLQAHVYAPDADVTIEDNSHFTGWLICRRLFVRGNSVLEYDHSLPRDSDPYSAAVVR